MEYEKKDWQRSDGRYRSLGKEKKDKKKPLTAYHPPEIENSAQKRPREMMKMESSYGGIAWGANREKELTMVVHERRRAKGPGLKKDQREVEGSRIAAISELRGDFRTNSHSRRDSAIVYKERLEETPLYMMERIQEMMDENYQQSGQKVLPFMRKREDEELRKEIQEQLRASLEKDDRSGTQFWSREQESFYQERSEKQEMYRRFYRELEFTQEKAKNLIKKEDPIRTFYFGTLAGDATEDLPEEEPDEAEEKN